MNLWDWIKISKWNSAWLLPNLKCQLPIFWGAEQSWNKENKDKTRELKYNEKMLLFLYEFTFRKNRCKFIYTNVQRSPVNLWPRRITKEIIWKFRTERENIGRSLFLRSSVWLTKRFNEERWSRSSSVYWNICYIFAQIRDNMYWSDLFPQHS